jgi:thiol-disulfide isomerase/thioredoxin
MSRLGVLRRSLPLMLAAGLALASAVGEPQRGRAGQASDAETRVLDYIRDHLRPGQPLLISELYSNVFTQPDERQALDKLYNAFFRIPLFLAEYQQKFGAPPRLQIIAQQFDLKTPGAADILLRVMEADPRVPRFLTRDPKTGEITHVDVEMIRSDPRFAHAVTVRLSGWEGRPAPDFKLSGLDGRQVDSTALHGKLMLLYVWFTGCPPCMKETPSLVKLQSELGGRGLTIVGANADRVLGLGYDDEVRRRYARDQHVNFAIVNWTKESDAAYGRIAVFPTLFLISGKGVIIHHWVGYVRPEELRQAVLGALEGS